MVEKKFFKAAEDMKEVAPDYGACFATDLITVDGHPVGFMYREDPDNEIDSGWRFLAGFESEEYMDDDANMGIYDVNTIANYDPAIIDLLDSAVGTAFERAADSDSFVKVTYAFDEA